MERSLRQPRRVADATRARRKHLQASAVSALRLLPRSPPTLHDHYSKQTVHPLPHVRGAGNAYHRPAGAENWVIGGPSRV